MHQKTSNGVRSGFLFTYFLQLTALANFYLRGLSFTLRNAVSVRGRGKNPYESARLALSRDCQSFFTHLERLGLLETQFEGFERIDGISGTILAANHPGLFDAFLVFRRFPHAACVMRSDLRKNICFRGYSRECGFVPNDNGREFLDAAIKALRRGDNLLVFPEGTRTAPGQILNPFQRGFAHAAIRAGAPVQTILIQQEGDYLRKGQSLLAPARFPIRIALSLGELFYPAPREKVSAFCERVRAWFLERLTHKEINRGRA